MTGETPAQSRERLAAEQIRQARAELLQGAKGNPFRPSVEPDIATLQAEAAARAAVPRATSGPGLVSRSLPVAARYATGEKKGTFSPRIWVKDATLFQGIKNFVPNAWQRAVRGTVRTTRESGEVRSVYIVAAASSIAWLAGQNQGRATISLKELAAEIGCRSKDTARRALRWLEDHGLLRTTNNMIPDKEKVRIFDRNSYFPRTPIEATEDAPDPVIAAPSPIARAGIWIAELAPYFKGLAARAFWLNTTPSASEKQRAAAHAAMRDPPIPA